MPPKRRKQMSEVVMVGKIVNGVQSETRVPVTPGGRFVLGAQMAIKIDESGRRVVHHAPVKAA